MNHIEHDNSPEPGSEVPLEETLFRLLSGAPGHEIHNQDGYLPTDTAKVLESLAGRLQSNAAYQDAFRQAMGRLASDPERGWLLMYYLIDLLGHFQTKLGFTLFSPEEIATLGAQLAIHEATHRANRGDGGDMYPEGIWGDVRRLNGIIASEYGVRVLPEPV